MSEQADNLTAISKRRQPGEIVVKKAGAGFSMEGGRGLIPIGSDPSPCCICDDPECLEWPDLWPVDEQGKPLGGNWCHVSECQMEDSRG